MAKILIEKVGIHAKDIEHDAKFPDGATVISYKIPDRFLRRVITRVNFGNLSAQVRFTISPDSGEIYDIEELLFEAQG